MEVNESNVSLRSVTSIVNEAIFFLFIVKCNFINLNQMVQSIVYMFLRM